MKNRPGKRIMNKVLLKAITRLENNGYLCGECDYRPIKDCEFECPILAELRRLVRERGKK